MWNKKRLDDLEKRIAFLEAEGMEGRGVHIPESDPNYLACWIQPRFSIVEAIDIIINYLHLKCHKNPEIIITSGILDKREDN